MDINSIEFQRWLAANETTPEDYEDDWEELEIEIEFEDEEE